MPKVSKQQETTITLSPEEWKNVLWAWLINNKEIWEKLPLNINISTDIKVYGSGRNGMTQIGNSEIIITFTDKEE